jgi:hypothetical protein
MGLLFHQTRTLAQKDRANALMVAIDMQVLGEATNKDC